MCDSSGGKKNPHSVLPSSIFWLYEECCQLEGTQEFFEDCAVLAHRKHCFFFLLSRWKGSSNVRHVW